MDKNTLKLKLDSLHFNIIVIVSFLEYISGVQSQNNNYNFSPY
jgi:hypothetical protein